MLQSDKYVTSIKVTLPRINIDINNIEKLLLFINFSKVKIVCLKIEKIEKQIKKLSNFKITNAKITLFKH